ncbi:SDR family NAD(P)-dependent oxidoreductase [Salipiger sp.]|uniref:SDR family NAD(P)-dependent oxidoreductase n=1 Tax=Salipiger sp. TaxID=2078585 RepID=UPI003A986572
MNENTATPRITPRDWMKRSMIDGMVALVAGGGSGMGAATARTYAANDGHVVVADLNLDNAEVVARDIRAEGGRAIAIRMNVADPEAIEVAVAATVAEYGRIDSLINSATWSQNCMLEDVDMKDWADAFQTNVHGPLLLARACLPYLRKSPNPAIVHVGSLAGVTGYARKSAYSASKGALIAMSRQLALEWGVDNIRVNVLVPGTIETPLFSKMVHPTIHERFLRGTPLGRLGTPEDMADLAVFLVSPAASFITGQAINCCGGFSMDSFVIPAGMTETLKEARAQMSDDRTD